MKTIKELTSTNAQTGKVEWVGVRPQRRAALEAVLQVQALAGGLEGDHYSSGGKRSVSLIQAEHLPAIASFLGRDMVAPEDLRRNLVISSVNLLGLRHRQFKIGEALFEGSGLCAPCSRMEETLGTGGYAAVRGHGGIVAQIIEPGFVKIGDSVIPS